MSSLPEELYLEILKRVPVKSTFACKCVCKSWFKMISNLDFDLMHQNLSMQRYKLMIESHNGISFSSISYDSLSSSSNAVVEMDFPHKSSKCKIKLLGSCNGLVSFWNYRLKCYFVWNPATEEYKKLVKADSDENNNFDYSALYGFGYDSMTDDYKVVSILTYDQLIHVYSSKSGSWNSFWLDKDELNQFSEAGVFFNGALHWLRQADATTILSMNIGEERFDEELQLPAALLKTQNYMDMGVLEGCLCLLAGFKEFFEVWIMQDYGVQESWTKLYSIRFKNMMWDDIHFGELMGSCSDGQILFRQLDSFFLYDPKFETARKQSIPGLDGEDGAVSYFESLVSLNSVTAVGRRKKRKITRKLKTSTTKKRNRNGLNDENGKASPTEIVGS